MIGISHQGPAAKVVAQGPPFVNRGRVARVDRVPQKWGNSWGHSMKRTGGTGGHESGQCWSVTALDHRRENTPVEPVNSYDEEIASPSPLRAYPFLDKLIVCYCSECSV